MKKQDSREANNQQSVIEDLTVNEAQAEGIKAGDGKAVHITSIKLEHDGF